MNSAVCLPGLEPAAGIPPAARVLFRKRAHERPDHEHPAVAEAFVYRKDVVFKIKTGRKLKPRLTKRKAISGFSAESARRLERLIRNTNDLWESFLTLTYPGRSFGFDPVELDGRIIKQHVHAFCTWLGRRSDKKNKVAYVWVLEFTKTGRPHFHFLLTGFVNKDLISAKWAEIVGSGDPRHLRAGTRIEGVKNPDTVGAYMGKYVSKMTEQKIVPAEFKNVGRFWGASRCLTVVTYRMKDLYRGVASELRIWRRQNQAVRRSISAQQAGICLEHAAKAEAAETPGRKANFEKLSRSCARRALTYAKRWRWKGYGFILLRGAETFRALLRQAVEIDRGGSPWERFDRNEKRRAPKYETPADAMSKIGQFKLDGSFEQYYRPDRDCQEGETYYGTSEIS